MATLDYRRPREISKAKKKAKGEVYEFPNPTVLEYPAELIKRRRLQMLVHSCLYYCLNENIWDDHTFDKNAKELAVLLKEDPDVYSDRFDEYFKGWDGSSGFHLPHRDSWVLSAAQNLLASVERMNK
jgi:hypothetical protein